MNLIHIQTRLELLDARSNLTPTRVNQVRQVLNMCSNSTYFDPVI